MVNLEGGTPEGVMFTRVDKIRKGKGTHGCCSCGAILKERKYKIMAHLTDSSPPRFEEKQFFLCYRCWTHPPEELALGRDKWLQRFT